MKYLVFSIKMILFGLFLYTLYFILNTPVNAQQVSLSLSPSLVQLFIKPGKSVMAAYNLSNLGDPTFLNLKILPFEAKGSLGDIRIKPEFEGPVRFSLDNSDIKLDQPFFMKTKDKHQVLLRIRVPENIDDGDYYYSLQAENAPPTASEGISSARIKATIVSNILMTVSNSGNIEIKPRIILFSLKNGFNFGRGIKIFDSFDKIPVILIVANKGKNIIRPEGKINLNGIMGEKIKYDLIPQNILSQSERTLTPDLVLSGFYIGKYNLSAELKFGENSPQVFASTAFYVFPFKIGLGIILTSIVIILIIKRREDND